VGIVVGGWATDNGHEKGSSSAGGSAGRGTSACVGIVVGGRATDSRHEKRSGSARRGTSAVCIVMGGRALDSGHEKRGGSVGRGTSAGVGIVVGGRAADSRHQKRSCSARRGTSAVYVVMGGRATDSRHVDGLRIVGSKAKWQRRSWHMCMCGHSYGRAGYRWQACGWTTDSGHEKRKGSAGRGTSACVGIVVGGRATDSRHVDGLRIVGKKWQRMQKHKCMCGHSCGWAGYR